MNNLTRLLNLYATATGRTVSTVGRLVGGRGDVADRARAGTMTIARAGRITQRLSDNWPEKLPWLADIPRPTPSPDSPAARPVPATTDNGAG